MVAPVRAAPSSQALFFYIQASEQQVKMRGDDVGGIFKQPKQSWRRNKRFSGRASNTVMCVRPFFSLRLRGGLLQSIFISFKRLEKMHREGVFLPPPPICTHNAFEIGPLLQYIQRRNHVNIPRLAVLCAALKFWLCRSGGGYTENRDTNKAGIRGPTLPRSYTDEGT